MKSIILLLLNFPFTFTGLIPLIISSPYSFKLNRKEVAFIFKVKSFWWGFSFMKNARAMTIGHIILLGPRLFKNDLEHELIHVKQCQKYPLIFPLLYFYEFLKKGYRQNRFENEAYRLSKSVYEGR